MRRRGFAIGAGLVLVALGVLLLLRQVGVWPRSVRLWPVVLLALGLGMLFTYFRAGWGLWPAGGLVGPFVLLTVGGFGLLRDLGAIGPGVGVWPFLLIAIGVAILVSSMRGEGEDAEPPS